ncbi:zinc metalloproteinase nas-13 [Neodiprion pinetum]|uniref:Metalloendopeptidase n=1 Tax=Neodiprion lecontei TaxID=441921 RepID=A0A6J0BEU0_NEOLC|nr:zinc metalloproteinase nas-13 [Neodiprion lecontei]XP_015513401.1 zinc metalloproteinase nas-13 [Neodiprion lecontei]XP_046416957.1 zinc metalloproteinase nas-13-like [Neodiprion fabricii]XP_046416958.1 zinc metalloproteinase nas-13-like [Neodiprion fabricii]XP_046472983.1 zinc metalloproteinase nas-13-like [Neodiprion pinetum]XP_046472984.1 zinc metalloproteinase nas-13-like [Neodiprion pinetum]XP_046611618.1 zinc metalloproteinase nas-13-like [Neodiprion virginianus]XP_046611619.1 zinc 
MAIERSALLLTILLATSSAWPYFRRRDIFDNAVDSPNGPMGYMRNFEEVLHALPNNDTGRKVAEWHEQMEINPEELGEYAEGDILFPEGMGRNGLKSETMRWPGGVVPYMISPYFTGVALNLIHEAMDDFHKNTCIKFKPYAGEETDYIRIAAGNTGCWSSVGRTGGRQDVNLQVPGCVTKKGTIIHELMHAVGFLHEQNRWERDDHVLINWGNIQSGRRNNFERATKETTDAFGVGYDYGSVMHYSSNAFSTNGKPTIEPKEPGGLLSMVGEYFFGKTKAVLGQREGFSTKDIQKIRRMYKCAKRRRSYN